MISNAGTFAPPSFIPAEEAEFLRNQIRSLESELERRALAQEAVERRLRVQYHVSRTFAEAETLEGCMASVLEQIGTAFGWDTGAAWFVDRSAQRLRCAHFWTAPGSEAPHFESASRDASLRRGEGLPGQVWEQPECIWVDDLASGRFTRSEAARADGLAAGYLLPIRKGTELCGVFEFFTRRKNLVSHEDLAVMAAFGEEIGNFLKRRDAETQLKRAIEALAMSNRELEQFAYVASHDLQEPLRKILAFSDRLKSRYWGVGDLEKDYFDRMQSAAIRMKTLIEDLLHYSRVTTNRSAFAPVDMNEVLSDVLQDLDAKIAFAQAEIERERLPVVSANAFQMRQVMQNLLSNALKFAKKGETPKVRITCLDLGNGYKRITVADDGIGFDPKYIQKIFQPFQRLHQRGEYEGNGIGLAVCQKIVLAHGGTITADSRPGEGSSFHVTLPVDRFREAT